MANETEHQCPCADRSECYHACCYLARKRAFAEDIASSTDEANARRFLNEAATNVLTFGNQNMMTWAALGLGYALLVSAKQR